MPVADDDQDLKRYLTPEGSADSDVQTVNTSTTNQGKTIKDLEEKFQNLRNDIGKMAEVLEARKIALKGVLEANDTAMKQKFDELSGNVSKAISELTQHDSVFSTAAQNLGSDQTFMKKVIEEVHGSLESRVAKIVGELEQKVDGIECNIKLSVENTIPEAILAATSTEQPPTTHGQARCW